MKKRIEINYSTQGVTTAVLSYKNKKFIGMSFIHPDDPLPPSFMIGTDIAEARANIKLYNYLIQERKIRLKGVKQALYSIPESNPGYVYISHTYKAIEKEIEDFIQEKRMWQKKINSSISGRKMYINSRTMDRETRDKQLEILKEGLAKLSQVKKD